MPERSADALSFWLVMRCLALLAMTLLITPTVVVLITSFTSSYSLKFPPPGYSLRWYRALFIDSPELLDAMLLSVRLSVFATVASILIAVPAALAIARRKEWWARALETLFLSPLMLPTLAIGLSLLMLLNLMGVGLSFATLVIGHIVITAPYIFRTTVASLAQFDGALFESAYSLGAKPWFMFRTVTLPLISPGVMAGAFIGFMYSFDNVSVSLFLSDARNVVLPMRMWNIIEASLDVRAAAVSGVLIAVTLVLMVVMERVVGISRFVR